MRAGKSKDERPVRRANAPASHQESSVGPLDLRITMHARQAPAHSSLPALPGPKNDSSSSCPRRSS